MNTSLPQAYEPDGSHVAYGEMPPVYEPPEAPDFSPFAALGRFLRGRKKYILGLTMVIGPALGYLGYTNGTKTWETSAILRVYPQESSILYKSGDDSVLKTFEAFVKAETTYVASYPVMARAYAQLQELYPEESQEFTIKDLTGSVEVKRSESLIILKSASKDPQFLQDKMEAIVNSYMALKEETEDERNSVRLEELQQREAELLARFADLNARILEAGGEYDINSLAKAHIEKVGQIDKLAARQAEVRATLEQLRNSDGASSADMSDQEIMRATLLDRALADLNFDKAKREAELETLLLRYTRGAPIVQDKLNQIAIIDQAMSERREQIKVLGQTGALTDTSNSSPETQLAEIQALYDKVTDQVERAKAEARSLNAKRIELDFLGEERAELRALLDETRQALDIIRLESGNALPGLTVLMAPPAVPEDPAEDSGKMLAAAGFAGGGFLSLILVIIGAMMNGRVRFSDELWQTSHLVPILRVVSRRDMRKPDGLRREIEKLRNEIMLLPVRSLPVEGRAKIIAVARLDKRAPDEIAQGLAESFARTQLSTILVDADLITGKLSRNMKHVDTSGWAEMLMGEKPDPIRIEGPRYRFLPVGRRENTDDSTVAITAIRRALIKLAAEADVIIVNAGSLEESLTTELILSAADLGIGVVSAGDQRRAVTRHLLRLDDLPRNGGATIFTNARGYDPGLV